VTPEEFRSAGHALIDWIADHRTHLSELPVQAQTRPGDVRALLPGSLPAGPTNFTEVLRDLEQVIVPGITQIQHPRFFGWFPANASLASVLGDIASGGLGALGITWQSAPALTELEEVVVEWLRQLTGLSPEWRGAIHDTASTACLVAMLAAREKASEFSQNRGGLQSEASPLVVYTSSQAHSSVLKAALLAGFGKANVRLVETDTAYAIKPTALQSALAEDVAAGRRPALVVASVGTTGTTAIDPVAEMVAIARRFNAWVHVDAAMAGSAMILPEMRHIFDGVNNADSLSWNPHKWLGTLLDCSLLYVRDPQHLVRVMSTNPSYLHSADDGDVTQFKDWGIPLGRRFRSLKLWFQLRLDGIDTIRTRLRRDLANAQWLATQVAAEPEWRVLAPVVLQTVCLRHEPTGLNGHELDRHTLRWAKEINNSGQAFVTPAQLDGRWMVRVSIGAEATEHSDVSALWELLKSTTAAD
jgi:aromatic-L-amino-acid/L-tryptophan decarboxylase